MSRQSIGNVLLVAFEVVFMLLFSRVIPAIGARFGTPSPTNAALIVCVYLVFCSGVLMVRRLEPSADGYPANAFSYLALPATLFGFFVLHMAVDTGGGYAWLHSDKSTGNHPLVTLIAIGGLVLALLYPILLIVPVKTTVSAGVRRDLLRFVGLLLAQAMIVVVAAYWERMGSESTSQMAIALPGKILIFLVIYVFYLLFVASPRLLLLAVDRSPTAIVCFLTGSSYYLWKLLDGSAWK